MTDRKDEITTRVVDLARALIRIPSRAGIDDPAPIQRFVAQWCTDNGVAHRQLVAGDLPVGLAAVVASGAGPSLCLNACIDTAPFGDESRWTHPPTEGTIEGGRLYGRGAADSKTAAAIFLVLASELQASGALTSGNLHLVLDADEHTGEFRGIKEYVRTTDALPEAIWIGYPGNHTIVAGSRGFARARVVVSGVSAHTGSRRKKGVNAISRASRLIALLEALVLPVETDPEFDFGPSLSITAITGGEGFSVVPDRCEINVDVRLTPGVSADAVRALVEGAVAALDRTSPGPTPTQVTWTESWPAYRTPDTDRAIACLRTAAEATFGRPIPTTVSGPSNIGNYLASLGVHPMSGFGVTYDNLHATDEWCEVGSVWRVYEAYWRAALNYLVVS